VINRAPHSSQNLAVSPFWCWHCGQCMTPPYFFVSSDSWLFAISTE
jgi:hypothetical protein